MSDNAQVDERDPVEWARQNKALMEGLRQACEGDERDSADIPGPTVREEARRRVRTLPA